MTNVNDDNAPNPTVVPEGCERAAKALSSAFTWEFSPEGHDYWEAIHDRLIAMAKSAREREGS